MLLIVVVLSGCGLDPAASVTGQCGLGETATLPIILHNQSALVRVTVNDRAAYLALDTGATTTTFNRDAAAVLGLQPMAGAGIEYMALHGTGQASRATIDAMRLGAWTLTDLAVAVVAESVADGVLGLDILSRYDVDVNLPQLEVVLHRGSLCPAETPDMAGERLELPTRRLGQRKGAAGARPFYLVVPVSLNGAASIAILDTGAAAGSLVSAAFAAKAGVQGASDQPAVQANSFGSIVSLAQRRFAALMVGRERFENVLLLVSEDPAWPVPFVLGYDYFIHHRVWFSFTSDRIFVSKVPSPVAR